MDNVLCRYDRSKRVAYLAELAGATNEFVYKAIWESGFESLGDCGALDAADYLCGFGERIGCSLSLEDWVEARRRSMQADRAMLEIADSLRKSVDIAVLTNNTTLVADQSTHCCRICVRCSAPESTPQPSSRLQSLTRAAIASACRSSM